MAAPCSQCCGLEPQGSSWPAGDRTRPERTLVHTVLSQGWLCTLLVQSWGAGPEPQARPVLGGAQVSTRPVGPFPVLTGLHPSSPGRRAFWALLKPPWPGVADGGWGREVARGAGQEQRGGLAHGRPGGQAQWTGGRAQSCCPQASSLRPQRCSGRSWEAGGRQGVFPACLPALGSPAAGTSGKLGTSGNV